MRAGAEPGTRERGGTDRGRPERSTTWWAAARRQWQLVGAVRVAGPVLLTGVWAVSLMRTVLPTLTGLSTGWLVSRLVSAPSDHHALVLAVLLSCALMLASQVLEAFAPALAFSASQRVDAWHRGVVAELMGRPAGIGHLEDPLVQDRLASALLKGLPGWASYSFGTAAVGQTVIVTRIVGACLATAVLCRFSPALAGGLLAVTLFTRFVSRREWLAQHAVVRALAPTTRRAAYWAEVGVMPWAAKELRIFGMTDWVVERFRQRMTARTRELAAVRLRLLARMRWTSLVLVAAVAGGLGALAHAAASGRITTGALAVYLGALWVVVAGNGMEVESFDVAFAGHPTLLALEELREVAGEPPAAPSAPSALPAAAPLPAPLVRFEDVAFRYPGARGPVLSGVDLEIAPGELLAVVGVNGAGKTTLTKLLTGMHQPTRGRITVDGRPLDAEPVDRWRRRIAVVLQDFVRYDLSFRDNVVLGAPWGDADPALLDEVAGRSGLDEWVRRAPDGWDTPLTRGRTGGIDLSGGQWQRVALARALYAVAQGARLLVLDEPTAHLDVKAELDTFTRIAESAGDAGVVLISHRLSTVRRADRIVLLDGGRVAEEGRHEELLALGGQYAAMFAAQADRFGEPARSAGTAAS